MRKKNSFRHLYFRIVTGLAALGPLAGCAPDLQLAGGGSDTEVSGRVVASGGQAISGVIVALIDTAYDPGFDGSLPSDRFDTTDATGSYRFDSLKAGRFNIAVSNPDDGTQALVCGIEVTAGHTTNVGDATLRAAALLRIVLPDHLADKPARLSALGTPLAITLSGSSNAVEFSAVPQGVLPGIRYKQALGDSGILLFRNVAISSAGTIVLNPNAFNEVSGKIAGLPAGDSVASVTIIPLDYNPAFGGVLPGKMGTVSGRDGSFHFYNIDRGAYNLYATHTGSGLKSLYSTVIVDSQPSIAVPDVRLKGTATLIVPIPDSLQASAGYVCMPGSHAAVQCGAGGKTVIFDSIAQGTYLSIVFQGGGSAPAVTLFTNVVIDSAGVFVLDPYAAWQHSARIILNTTAGGANIQETLFKFPILVHLTATNFNFSEAKKQGEDLRVTTPDDSPLAFEIERWDSANAAADIWIKADTVYGNDDSHYLLMRWGNPKAKALSGSVAVFDTADGFRGVWHLDESGGTTQIDATIKHYNGTPIEMDGSSDVPGAVGRAQDFDGSSQCIAVLDARQSSLDVQVDTAYTVSAWVYARNLQKDNRVIVSKGSAHYGLTMNEQNRWTFYGGRRGYGVDTTTTAPAAIDVWTFLTGVRKGKRQYLYVNGSPVDSTLEAAGVDVNISNNFYDLLIGRQSDDESQWFDGVIDEVRVTGKADGSGWIRLCYENQKAGQTFVTIRRIK